MLAPPYRGPYGHSQRPTDIPLPPERMPLVRDLRLLKRWRYIGGYNEQWMFCVLAAQVGPLKQSAWAIRDRRSGSFLERTKFGRGDVALAENSAQVSAKQLQLSLAVNATDGFEVATPTGRSYIWTRKQLATATGSIEFSGRREQLSLTVLVDDSAGYYPRHTQWLWSAGIGLDEAGREVGWNLVTGINDGPLNSERTVWLDGEPTEVGPVSFLADLGGVRFENGERLNFTLENERARNDNLLVIRSRYRQPFGSFSGQLPIAGKLTQGFGVMESHEVVW